MRSKLLATLAAVTIVMVTAAPAGASPPKLKIRLTEFQIEPAREFNAKGKTKFVAKNVGTEEHELVVVRGDDPSELPTLADGSVDEDAISESDVVGEIEEIKPGKKKSKVFKLRAGSYILFCNVVQTEPDGTVESHFEEGMYTTIDAS